jgi:hypothetical protein
MNAIQPLKINGLFSLLSNVKTMKNDFDLIAVIWTMVLQDCTQLWDQLNHGDISLEIFYFLNILMWIPYGNLYEYVKNW